MTHFYLVRHAEPDHDWKEDSTRPLTQKGLADCKKVTTALSQLPIDAFYASPYKRSVDTIKGLANYHLGSIETDERLRERENGTEGNKKGMFEKRWEDFDYHEEGGESLSMVQKRNGEVIKELLKRHKDENVVIGTHGTAMSTIIHLFEPSFGCEDFLKIIDYMPYIVRLDFEGTKYMGREDVLIIHSPYTKN